MKALQNGVITIVTMVVTDVLPTDVVVEAVMDIEIDMLGVPQVEIFYHPYISRNHRQKTKLLVCCISGS